MTDETTGATGVTTPDRTTLHQRTERSAEGVGNDVYEATAAACKELGVEPDEVEVEVLAYGVAALPGESVSGAESRVRVWELDATTRRALTLLTTILDKIGLEAEITVRAGRSVDDADAAVPPAILDVHGDDLGLLIGWRGETLQALQTLVHLMIANDQDAERKVYIDVEQYRSRREEYVRGLAHRIAQRVLDSGEKYVLDPMQPYERRIVHLVLQDEPGVRTESVGNEPRRRVAIIPTNPDAAPHRNSGSRYGSREGRGQSSWRDREPSQRSEY